MIGHVLPITRSFIRGRWQTGPWFLRDERCYLIPGDSPLGYRLPLDSQPWVAKGDYPYVNPPDPHQPQAPLPAYAAIRRQLPGGQTAVVNALSADEAGAGTSAAARAAAALKAAQDAGRLTPTRGAARNSASRTIAAKRCMNLRLVYLDLRLGFLA